MHRPTCSVIVAAMALLTVLTGSAMADPSPTGREPRLLWTAERQAVWNRMRTDYESNPSTPPTLGGTWFKLVKNNAECGCRYADTGLWATYMYQWTGDTKYVELAWKQLSAFIKKPVAQTDGNYVREYGIEYVVTLDWLWPGLNAQRRTEFINAIGAMLNNALKGNKSIDGYRMADSDQVTGTYFAVALFYLTHPDNPVAQAAFFHPKTGGLDATALDRATARNSVRSYVEQLAAGGEWIESASYNLGTVNLLLMGAEAVRTATRNDHFPEVTRWLPQWARRQMAFWTPDLAQVYQWGDEEHPRTINHYEWTNASGLAAGLLQGTTSGAQLQQQLLDLIGKYGAVGLRTMEPIVTGRVFFTFNPYAPGAEWRTEKAFHASGAGLLLFKSGFSESDSLFASHVAPRPGKATVDHIVDYLNDFELWRKGQWVITHPRGYGGTALSGLGTNAVLMQGMGDMPEFKELVGAAIGADYAYQVGTTGGAAVPATYYNPPPLFVHEWTRGVLYLAGATDIIVVHDRTNMSEVLRKERYSAAVRAQMDRAPSPKQWVLHMPVRPRIESSGVTWSVGGESVTWSPLLPTNPVMTPYDEAALRKGGDPAWKSSILDGELKHHVRIWPSVNRGWDTFLNVIQVGTPRDVALIRGKDEVEGVLLSGGDGDDRLVVFNARASAQLEPGHYNPSHEDALRQARLRRDGFTVTWSARGEQTQLFLADLDPAQRWSATVDGRTQVTQSSSDPDLLRFVVSGSGTHTVNVRPMGPAESLAAPAVPASPSGLKIFR